jgi:hypothetical protein
MDPAPPNTTSTPRRGASFDRGTLSGLADTLDPTATITPALLARIDPAASAAASEPPDGATATVAATRAPELSFASRARLGEWMRSLPSLTVHHDPPDPSDHAVGKPDLTLQGPLGHGGMGIVLRATQRALSRDVAVKMLHPETVGEDKARALLREALIMGRLEHPNIVPVYTLGQLGPGQPAIVMKRIDGVSWHDLLHTPEHPAWRELDADDRLLFHLTVLIQICRALEFAHGHQIIHRDIKPANVMIGAYGEVYLLDWGIALHLEERSEHDPPALLGTPSSMAPEMVRGVSAAIDPRTDVYLLGATLHEILTGRPRHAAHSLLAALAAAERSDPALFGPDVPAELAAIVNRATAADPAHRHPSVAALRHALRDYLRHRDSRALSDEARERARLLEAAIDAAQADPSDSLAQIPALFAAASFGFQMALQAWPENQEAAAGLVDAARRLLWFELRRGDLDHVERLLHQHPRAAEPELLAELARRRDEDTRRRDEIAALRSMRDDLDLRRNETHRRRLFLAFSVPVIGLSVPLLYLAPDDSTLTWSQILGAFAVVILSYIGIVWRYRAVALTTLVDRRLTLGLLLILTAMGAHRIFAWHDGATISHTLTGDLFIGTFMSLLLASLLERRMFWIAAPFALGFALARALPDRTGLAFTLAGILSIFAIVPIFRATARAPEPG